VTYIWLISWSATRFSWFSLGFPCISWFSWFFGPRPAPLYIVAAWCQTPSRRLKNQENQETQETPSENQENPIGNQETLENQAMTYIR
jgi:hypothetical protein